MIERIYTIGVYGRSEQQFFRDLEHVHIDLFCDIRQRRGVRGSQYAFANSTRLQGSLAVRRIGYLYLPELAPTQRIRELQHEADRQQGIAKRERQELGATFREHYTAEVLNPFDTSSLREQMGSARHVVLFCVEGTATACHRALVAERLGQDWDVKVEHL